MKTHAYSINGFRFELHDYNVCIAMTVYDGDREVAVTDELADRTEANDWISRFFAGLNDARRELQHFAMPPACLLLANDIAKVHPARKAGTIAAIKECH